MGGLLAYGLADMPKDKFWGTVSAVGFGFLVGIFWPVFLGYIAFLLFFIVQS